jgi:hypothetical protein
MGREIRRVPPNWDHPKKQELRWVPKTGYAQVEEYQPMYGHSFDEAAAEWKAEFLAWENGEKLQHMRDDGSLMEYWEWNGQPPDRAYYRPWKDEEATWFQLWETVTEGTPVSPPFATKQELAQYLAKHGDFWDEKRGNGGWGIERSSAFCESGWAPSFVIQDGRVMQGTEAALAFGTDKPPSEDPDNN